jgi:hypothetical protein
MLRRQEEDITGMVTLIFFLKNAWISVAVKPGFLKI